MLVHGPLSFTLLTLLLNHHIKRKPENFINEISYKNLAPLYAGEPLKLCGRELSDDRYELWAETPQGGIAVKATAKVGPHPED
jgi:hydroxyacyl-ACP dehydratase HTD2-like protein with hotdog domain